MDTSKIEPFTELVTPQWVKEQMVKYGKKNKHLVEDLCIAKAEISAMINGHTTMSVRSKAMFYYYFKYLDSVSL